MGGDDAFVAELIDQFVTDSPALVAAARRGLEAGDADEVRRAAHTLKSNAATFGANELADRSSRLEAAARAGRSTTAPRSSRPSRTSSRGSTPRCVRAPRSPSEQPGRRDIEIVGPRCHKGAARLVLRDDGDTFGAGDAGG